MKDGAFAAWVILTLVVAWSTSSSLGAEWRMKYPEKRPFAWGYFQGVAFGMCLLAPLFEWDGAIFFAWEASLSICGVFMYLRHRWAWVIGTLISFNPFLWIVNGIYLAHRWKEIAGEVSALDSRTIEDAPPPPPPAAPQTYYVLNPDGATTGPFEWAAITSMRRTGQILEGAMFCQPGDDKWQPLIPESPPSHKDNAAKISPDDSYADYTDSKQFMQDSRLAMLSGEELEAVKREVSPYRGHKFHPQIALDMFNALTAHALVKHGLRLADSGAEQSEYYRLAIIALNHALFFYPHPALILHLADVLEAAGQTDEATRKRTEASLQKAGWKAKDTDALVTQPIFRLPNEPQKPRSGWGGVSDTHSPKAIAPFGDRLLSHRTTLIVVATIFGTWLIITGLTRLFKDSASRTTGEHPAGTRTKSLSFYEWMSKAESGDDEAEFNVGKAYDDGEEVPMDFAAAAKWYLQAANHGNARAQCNLSYMYSGGRGIPKDDVLAYKWDLLAAAQGVVEARENLMTDERALTIEQRAEGQRLAGEFKPQVVPVR